MSFLLDTDICSSYLKNEPRVVAKVMQHFGGLHVSVVTVGELMTWALRARAPRDRLAGVRDLLAASIILDVDLTVAERFGEIRADLLDRGRTVGELDLLNAAIALTHNLTVTTHNTQDYAAVAGLSIVDWLVP
jgi:tRNA(fMet)-specific endonuclease VapC